MRYGVIPYLCEKCEKDGLSRPHPRSTFWRFLATAKRELATA